MLVVWSIRSFVVDANTTAAPVAQPVTTVLVDTAGAQAPVGVVDAKVVAAGEVAGVPAGYPRTRAGATTAAVNWVASFPRLVKMGPLRLGDTLRQFMTTRGGALYVEDAVADYLDLFAQLGTEFQDRVWVESPLQTHVAESSAASAVVLVWSVVVTGDRVDGPIEAVWRTHRIELVWERDDWKIDAVTVTEGPTPVPADQALPGEASEFVEINNWTPAVFADTTEAGED